MFAITPQWITFRYYKQNWSIILTTPTDVQMMGWLIQKTFTTQSVFCVSIQYQSKVWIYSKNLSKPLTGTVRVWICAEMTWPHIFKHVTQVRRNTGSHLRSIHLEGFFAAPIFSICLQRCIKCYSTFLKKTTATCFLQREGAQRNWEVNWSELMQKRYQVGE